VLRQARAECRELFKLLGIITLPCIYIMECALKVKKNISRFSEHVVQHQHNTRNDSGKIHQIHYRTEMYKRGPFCECITVYNNIPKEHT
jgi:hypothetical protein